MPTLFSFMKENADMVMNARLVSTKRRYINFPVIDHKFQNIPKPTGLRKTNDEFKCDPTDKKYYMTIHFSSNVDFPQATTHANHITTAEYNHHHYITGQPGAYVYFRCRFTEKSGDHGLKGPWSNVLNQNNQTTLATTTPVPKLEGISIINKKFSCHTPANFYNLKLQVQVSTSSTFNSSTNVYKNSNNGIGFSGVTLSLANNTVYYIRARYTTANSGGGTAGSWSDTLIYPEDVEIREPVIDVYRHANMSGTDTYLVTEPTSFPYYITYQYSESSNFATITNTFHDTTIDNFHTFKKITQLNISANQAKTYHFRARFTTEAYGHGQVGAWSKVKTFRWNNTTPILPTTPPQPESVHVDYYPSSNSGNKRIILKPLVPNLYYCQVQVSGTSNFATVDNIYNNNGPTNKDGSLTVNVTSNLAKHDRSYIRVRYTTQSNGTGIAGPWSDTIVYVFPKAPVITRTGSLLTTSSTTDEWYLTIENDKDNSFDDSEKRTYAIEDKNTHSVPISIPDSSYTRFRFRYTSEVRDRGLLGAWSAITDLDNVPVANIAPGAPGNPTLVARVNTAIEVKCTAPTTGGTPTSYEWFISTNNVVDTSDTKHTTLINQITITGLTKNTNYWINVRAKNATGTGNFASTPLATSTLNQTISQAPNIPGVPTLVSRLNTYLEISSTAPVGGGAVETYEWYISTDSTVDATDTKYISLTTTITTPGLTKNTNYWVNIRAKNSVGTSAFATYALSTATLNLPNPGQGLAGVPGAPALSSRTNTSLTLTCTAPVTGGIVTGYEWFISTDSTVNTSDTKHTSSNNTITIDGLTKNTNYWIDVRSKNDNGTSAFTTGVLATATLNVTEPGIPPVVELDTNTSSTLTFRCEVPLTGDAPTEYRWYLSTDSTVTKTDTKHTSTTNKITISGLQSIDYWLAVSAYNVAGESGLSNVIKIGKPRSIVSYDYLFQNYAYFTVHHDHTYRITSSDINVSGRNISQNIVTYDINFSNVTEHMTFSRYMVTDVRVNSTKITFDGTSTDMVYGGYPKFIPFALEVVNNTTVRLMTFFHTETSSSDEGNYYYRKYIWVGLKVDGITGIKSRDVLRNNETYGYKFIDTSKMIRVASFDPEVTIKNLEKNKTYLFMCFAAKYGDIDNAYISYQKMTSGFSVVMNPIIVHPTPNTGQPTVTYNRTLNTLSSTFSDTTGITQYKWENLIESTFIGQVSLNNQEFKVQTKATSATNTNISINRYLRYRRTWIRNGVTEYGDWSYSPIIFNDYQAGTYNDRTFGAAHITSTSIKVYLNVDTVLQINHNTSTLSSAIIKFNVYISTNSTVTKSDTKYTFTKPYGTITTGITAGETYYLKISVESQYSESSLSVQTVKVDTSLPIVTYSTKSNISTIEHSVDGVMSLKNTSVTANFSTTTGITGYTWESYDSDDSVDHYGSWGNKIHNFGITGLGTTKISFTRHFYAWMRITWTRNGTKEYGPLYFSKNHFISNWK